MRYQICPTEQNFFGMKVNNENSLNRSRKQNSMLLFHISGATCSLSIKGVLHYAGHGQKPQVEEYLTLSGFALSHPQEFHRPFALQFIPPSEEYLPPRISITAHTHLHTCMSVHLKCIYIGLFEYLLGRKKSPPLPVTLQSHAHSHSLIPLTHR